jgi:protocatechuate 3,4-dioxygenase beta subunit
MMLYHDEGQIILDASGEFMICGLIPGQALSLRVVGPSGPLVLSRRGDNAQRSREYSVRLGDAPMRVELLVDARRLVVDGEVRDANGDTVADALVLAAAGYPRGRGCQRPGLGGARKAATHAEGDFTLAPLAPGPWMFYAETPDGGTGCAWLDLSDGVGGAGLTLRLRP